VNLLSEVGVKTKVLKMSGAKDPDEYIKKFGVKRFEMLVDGAKDVIDYELNSLKSNIDLSSAENKIEYLKKAVEIISDIGNPIEREVYAGNIAKETGTMVDTILSQAKLLYKKKYKNQQNKEWTQIQQFSEIRKDRVNPQKINNLKEAKAEEGIISYICKNPESIDNITKKITPNDFTTDFNRRVFEELVAMSQRGNDIKISLLGENLSHEEMGSVARIIADNNNLINSEEVIDEFVKILLTAKDRLSKDDIISRDVSDLEEYRKKLLEKKK
ncbi:MAG: DnaB-like helicase N-terminal domain-containing protein, partial [Oscillospiraceae bacterium]